MDKEQITAVLRSMELIAEANRLLKRREPRYSRPPIRRNCLAGCVAFFLSAFALLRITKAGFPGTSGALIGTGFALGTICGSFLYRVLFAAWFRSAKRSLRSEARTVRRRIDSALQWDGQLDENSCDRLRTIRRGLEEAMDGPLG